MNTLTEQQYFYKMFDEMWGDDVYGEVMPIEVQYSLCEELAEIEHERITNALTLASGNQTKAAQSLNIGRTALIAKMKKYKLV
jgi:transcriptional regulator with PAS, ATPase and Fis domain